VARRSGQTDRLSGAPDGPGWSLPRPRQPVVPGARGSKNFCT